TSRRMIAIVPFGVLLAIDGWLLIWRHWRFGAVVASAIVVATVGHFALYCRDYFIHYPGNSFTAFELNTGEAFQRLAERDMAAGRFKVAAVIADNPFMPDYASLYLKRYGDTSLQQRTIFQKINSDL